ncbi:MAG TPA: metallophosphoesterase [Dermatophilaceae bacterium]|nr:metallophosphoesterase [Dermatophilaceae bacterium]
MNRYVVSDVHGHLADLVAVLQQAGLLDADARWSGGDSTLWVLGDLFDRGPDGIGAVDLMMRLETEAALAGGRATLLLGNHEILALAMRHFGQRALQTPDGRQDFAGIWYINGGNVRDQLSMTDEHVAWLSSRDSVAVDQDLLLMHCDSLEYLRYGESAPDINQAVRTVLADRDETAWWRLWARYVSRYHFVGRKGPTAARRMLDALDGERIVHGHSIISTLVGGPSSRTSGPLLYAEGLALDIDGGRYDGGPLLLVQVNH